MVVGSNYADGIYVKNEQLMNGKVTYVSSLGDKALFWDGHSFTIGRTEEAELLVRTHQVNM